MSGAADEAAIANATSLTDIIAAEERFMFSK